MTTPTDDRVTDHEQVSAITERLRAEADRVRTSLTRLRADQDAAWQRYLQDVHESLTQAQSDLDDACTRLDHERQRTRAKMREDLDGVIAKLHAQYDDLRVQLHLGEMDGAELVSGVRAEAAEMLERGRAAVQAARRELADRLG